MDSPIPINGSTNTVTMATIQELLAIGGKLIQAGDLPRADQVIRKILEIDPSVASAWHLLGVVDQLRGKLDEARGEL